ncbi:MAG: class I SAM-dependent methyltransferase [Bacteroidales bacterium]
MKYDPIKQRLGKIFNAHPILRKLFYLLLDVLLLRTWHIKKHLKVWARQAPQDSFVIDAGAGFGQYVFFMSRKYPSWNIVGVDVKDEQVADCNEFFAKIEKKDSVQYVRKDLTEYVSAKKANMILSVDVMEHILDDRKVFENFNKSLVSGGMLLISTPSDQGGSDVHDDHEESFVGEHVRDGYGVGDISEKLYSAGFSQVDVFYSYGTPGKLSWKLSMKLPILLINFSSLMYIVLPFYYICVMPLCLVLNFFDVAIHHSTGTGLIVKAYK